MRSVSTAALEPIKELAMSGRYTNAALLRHVSCFAERMAEHTRSLAQGAARSEFCAASAHEHAREVIEDLRRWAALIEKRLDTEPGDDPAAEAGR
jgi:hypothetical protein